MSLPTPVLVNRADVVNNTIKLILQELEFVARMAEVAETGPQVAQMIRKRIVKLDMHHRRSYRSVAFRPENTDQVV